MKYHLKTLLLISVLMAGCKTSHITAVWKKDQPASIYNRILVAAIIPGNNDTARMSIEKNIVTNLTSFGYQASSNVAEFGFNGLNETGEDNIYMSLCDAGVDAVLTLAFVDKATSKKLRKGSNKKYVSEYYYNHIWNYRNISKDNATASHKIQYSAELILFDLRTLESVVVLHQKENIILKNMTDKKIVKLFIKKLKEEKFISKQTKPVFKLKAF